MSSQKKKTNVTDLSQTSNNGQTTTPTPTPPLHPVAKLIILFFIILIIIIVLLYAFRPSFIMKVDINGVVILGDVDQCRLWLASIVTTLIIIFIIAIIMSIVNINKPK